MSMTQQILHDLASNPGLVVATVHNLQLVDITADAKGNELLHVKAEGGEQAVLLGTGKVCEDRRRDIGKVGYVSRASLSMTNTGGTQDGRACYFRAYLDQSLRRVPELDYYDRERENGDRPNVIGWRCDAKPEGFRAPMGLTPGEAGGFVRDGSVDVTVRVPAEFLRECGRYGMSPAKMLQGFACDAAGIINSVAHPRADGLGSNGSDERDMADAWMERAYSWQREEAEKFAALRETIEEQEEDRADVGYLLDEWEAVGGDKEGLIAAVEKMIVAKKKVNDGEFNPTTA